MKKRREKKQERRGCRRVHHNQCHCLMEKKVTLHEAHDWAKSSGIEKCRGPFFLSLLCFLDLWICSSGSALSHLLNRFG